MSNQDPHRWVSCSICGGEHDLGKCPGWRRRAATENILPRITHAEVERAFDAIIDYDRTRPYRMTPLEFEALRDLARRAA
jgi:hypothetical protein